MICPKCKGELSEIDSSEGITLDFCGSCKGLWFDAGEVAEYFELSEDVPELDKARATASLLDWQCPKCSGAVEELLYTALHDLKVDRCRACGGIWLDHGEVPNLHQLSAQLESPKSRMAKTLMRLKQKGYM